jgi:hypothetical protein
MNLKLMKIVLIFIFVSFVFLTIVETIENFDQGVWISVGILISSVIIGVVGVLIAIFKR